MLWVLARILQGAVAGFDTRSKDKGCIAIGLCCGLDGLRARQDTVRLQLQQTSQKLLMTKICYFGSAKLGRHVLQEKKIESTASERWTARVSDVRDAKAGK